jgi:hypothetical protein
MSIPGPWPQHAGGNAACVPVYRNAQVLGHGGQGHVHWFRQLAQRGGAPGQAVHHGPAARRGEGMEKIINGILKHILQYNCNRLLVNIFGL